MKEVSNLPQNQRKLMKNKIQIQQNLKLLTEKLFQKFEKKNDTEMAFCKEEMCIEVTSRRSRVDSFLSQTARF